MTEEKSPNNPAGFLLRIEDFDNFEDVKDFSPQIISKPVIATVRDLDEREELEPFIRSILTDASDTPHGPVEIVDILTHKLSAQGESGLSAIILKGKSFPKVRPKHVAHQIYRLEKIGGINFAIFAATGTILDGAKEQFSSTCHRLGCKYAVLDVVDLARLFVAHGFICPRDGRRTVAGRCKCGYSPKKRILNVLQKDSLKALDTAHKLGQRAGLVVLPTGSGKTRIAAEDAKRSDANSVLYVAHTHEILDVARSEFEAVFGRGQVIHHQDASSLDISHKINIATIQLLRKNLQKIDFTKFDYVVIDEFHHAAARSYREFIARIGPSFLLGLTATPFRGDRQDIAEICEQNVLVNFELRTGIDTGILCPYHYFGCFDDINYSNIRHNGIRYDIRDLERALIIPERDAAIVSKWQEITKEKATLAFCFSHRHAHRVANSFRTEGIPAQPYLSTTSFDDRQRLIEGLKTGELNVLCTVDVMNEGADLPFVECLLFLRPTESKRIFYQQLGRGVRKYVGKSHCTIIDFIGNFMNAYKIVEYQGLLPFIDDEILMGFGRVTSAKEVLNLPLGCEVHFEERVIDIFAQQTLDPRYATRHNIGRILIYQYQRYVRRLGRRPTRREIDRDLLLHSEFYKLVFGSWKRFEELMAEREIRKGVTH